MAVSEYSPIVKTGGLADVTENLSQAVQQLDHKVTVFLPAYRAALKKIQTSIVACGHVHLSPNERLGFALRYALYDNIPLYLIEHNNFFDREGLYCLGDMGYADNSKRFAFFSKAILSSCQLLNLSPDIIQCHDWQTALIPYYLKVYEQNNPFFFTERQFTKCILTIHNASYQQHTPATQLEDLNIKPEHFTSTYFKDYGQINLLKGGIEFADITTTVSPSYAKELMTEQGSHGLSNSFLRHKDKIIGILNGCNYSLWNPKTDKFIPQKYNKTNISGKSVCKSSLQEQFQLPVNSKTPLYAVISRLSEQKGFNLLIPALYQLLQENLQIIILGVGSKKIAQELDILSHELGNKCYFANTFSETLAHQIEAGADFFLMPSLFEPCGLNQIYSLKYGTVPIVRSVGGLKDTIIDCEQNPKYGTGFVFKEPSVQALKSKILSSIKLFNIPSMYKAIQKNGMNCNFNWKTAARSYQEIYYQIITK